MDILAVVTVIILIAADQYTKHLAGTILKATGSITIINGVINLTYVENAGAAFGVFQGGRWFFVLMTLAILTGIFMYYLNLPRIKPYFWVRVSLTLITAGAVGNLVDRFLNGFVIDFMHATFIDFPVFNLADVYVVCGTILFAVLLLFFIKEDDGTNTVVKKDKS